jgi:hypothetical protein
VPSSIPRTLDRSALERVLARAAELQASSAEPSEAMTDVQLIELGKEVGLTAEFLRQALAEEQTRVAVPETPGGIGGMFGPTYATASRLVRGTQAQVLDLVDKWMEDHEGLRVKRRFADRMTWEARRDFLGSIKRGFNVGGGGYELTRAGEVGATVVPVDEGRVLVRLDADIALSRSRQIGWASVVAGGSVAASTGVVALTAATAGGSLLVAGVIAGVWTLSGGATFVSMARAQRRTLGRVQLALEQVLDRLEHGDLRKPPSLLDAIADAAGLKAR